MTELSFMAEGTDMMHKGAGGVKKKPEKNGALRIMIDTVPKLS